MTTVSNPLPLKSLHMMRAKTVRRINRHRAAGQRIAFRSKNTLARQILEALRPLLPKGWSVYVQFDSWYASAKLIKYIRRQGRASAFEHRGSFPVRWLGDFPSIHP
jgi:phosphatidylserine/phosphatidylglycerophosphate/cardiolipin synthase-like enzyme